MLDEHTLHINLKVGLRETLSNDIQDMLDRDGCTAAEAAKLRGRLTWAACGMFGRCGRAGQAGLLQRQYKDDDPQLTAELAEALRFYKALVQVVEPRRVFLGRSPCSPVLMYTDASWEPQDMDMPGLGYIMCHPDLPVSRAGAAKVPASVLACFQDRQTQMALAILQCFAVFAQDHISGRDIVLFVDNQAVCAGVAKGACSSADCAYIISACHLLWSRRGCRTCIEWVPSDDNPADGLSRAGTPGPCSRGGNSQRTLASLGRSSVARTC